MLARPLGAVTAMKRTGELPKGDSAAMSPAAPRSASGSKPEPFQSLAACFVVHERGDQGCQLTMRQAAKRRLRRKQRIKSTFNSSTSLIRPRQRTRGLARPSVVMSRGNNINANTHLPQRGVPKVTRRPMKDLSQMRRPPCRMLRHIQAIDQHWTSLHHPASSSAVQNTHRRPHLPSARLCR